MQLQEGRTCMIGPAFSSCGPQDLTSADLANKQRGGSSKNPKLRGRGAPDKAQVLYATGLRCRSGPLGGYAAGAAYVKFEINQCKQRNTHLQKDSQRKTNSHMCKITQVCPHASGPLVDLTRPAVSVTC